MWKIIGYAAVGLVVVGLVVGLTIKIAQKTEGYKADEQNFYSFEYHPFIGGCARYEAFKKPTMNEVTANEVTSNAN